MKPELLTFDIFGTVLDWRSGLREAVRATGHSFDESRDFERIIDHQGAAEGGAYRDYQTLTKNSLTETLGMPAETAARIGAAAGNWPLFPDSRDGLRGLQKLVPCVAMTNSDFAHGEQIQAQLGFRLSQWVCAEETRLYKPDPGFWLKVAEKTGIRPGRHWWHVSAYADYDLEVARSLGLTCVFIPRPHFRPGFHHVEAADLVSLRRLVAAELSATGEPGPLRSVPDAFMQEGHGIRPIRPESEDEVTLVAARMRLTLVDVLGEEKGGSLYTPDWLRERVRFHLDPGRSTAQVLLSEDRAGRVTGHCIVRVEREGDGKPFGLFSTTYVEPESRRKGIANALLQRGEKWMIEQGMTVAATYTADTNAKLIQLYRRHGYAIDFAKNEMIRLSKPLG